MGLMVALEAVSVCEMFATVLVRTFEAVLCRMPTYVLTQGGRALVALVAVLESTSESPLVRVDSFVTG